MNHHNMHAFIGMVPHILTSYQRHKSMNSIFQRRLQTMVLIEIFPIYIGVWYGTVREPPYHCLEFIY